MEMVAERDSKHLTTHIGMLNIRKAFDTLWQEGMLYKLHGIGLRGKTWRIIQKLYEVFVCNVLIEGHLSDDIVSLRGLHQGAPCSMFLFAIFIDELLRKIQDFSPGVKFHGCVINAMAFADDIAVITTCKNDLQALFDISYHYSKTWSFEFNPKKCVTLCFGKLCTYFVS